MKHVGTNGYVRTAKTTFVVELFCAGLVVTALVAFGVVKYRIDTWRKSQHFLEFQQTEARLKVERKVMGEITRRSRAYRFGKEFGEDVVRAEGIVGGGLLRISDVATELNGDAVHVVIVAVPVQLDRGQVVDIPDRDPVHLHSITRWFDAEMGPDDSDIAILADMLQISEEECRGRLRKAELLD